jgi:hypothetical protein
VFGNRFIVGDAPGVRTEPNREDLAEIAAVVKNASRLSDCTTVNRKAQRRSGGHRRRSFSKAADIAVPGDGDLSPLPQVPGRRAPPGRAASSLVLWIERLHHVAHRALVQVDDALAQPG